MINLRKHEAGRSIVEILGVLAIMGIITIMGIRGYSQATETMKRNATVEDMITIVQTARTIYAARGVYGDGTTSGNSAISAAVLQAKFGSSGIDQPTPLGNATRFVLRAVNVSDTDAGEAGDIARAFAVGIINLTQGQCRMLSNMGWTDAVYGDTGTLIVDMGVPNAWSFNTAWTSETAAPTFSTGGAPGANASTGSVGPNGAEGCGTATVGTANFSVWVLYR
ncbi:MAG: hypothetical protein FWD15_05845 [Alphaproteobacteria bacterium]|nr:hypothetical protein [Alphaproteobacteria bacterium]